MPTWFQFIFFSSFSKCAHTNAARSQVLVVFPVDLMRSLIPYNRYFRACVCVWAYLPELSTVSTWVFLVIYLCVFPINNLIY